MTYGPDPNAVHPNVAVPSVCFIKNVVTRKNISIGDYTYYDDPDGAEDFEAHVTYHYEFLGDRLVIGKFCAIARGITFIMNGANHRMNSVTTYPFNIMGHGWEKCTPTLEDLPFKGDTVVGNDVWIGQGRDGHAGRPHWRWSDHCGGVGRDPGYTALSRRGRQSLPRDPQAV